MAKPRAIVIIPTYNERTNIQRVVPKLFEVFKKIDTWDMHVLVVDDTSPDKTYDVVKKMQKNNTHLHLVINKKKSGLGGAYLRGMAEAFDELKADLVFEFDADLSHDPTKIPEFLKKIDAGADMVLGSRYIPGGGIPQDWGFHRKFLSVVGNLFIMFVLTDFSIRDWTGGYRALTKKVYEAIHPELHTERFSGYTFQIGFLHKAVRKGFKIEEVPFVFVDRTEGHSKLGPEYIVNNLAYIMKVRLQEILNHRIFRFLVVGGFGTVIQLASLYLYRALLPDFTWLFLTNFLLATFFSIETAITSNFIFNNAWTFADRKLKIAQIPFKFLTFNLASGGSILIQLIVATIGQQVFGLFDIFTLAQFGITAVNFSFDSGTLYVMIGILIGLF